MKNYVFWDVTPCVSCKNRRFGGAKFLRNVGSYKSDTAQHPRRRHSSFPIHQLSYHSTLKPCFGLVHKWVRINSDTVMLNDVGVCQSGFLDRLWTGLFELPH
jgi:hypothetical protein